jgi:hypothetical protein
MYQVCGVNGAGEPLLQQQMKAPRLMELMARFKPCLVGLEACRGEEEETALAAARSSSAAASWSSYSKLTSGRRSWATPDGIVRVLFDADNGRACDASGTLKIHGLEDCGWYRIDDETSSAVPALVSGDVLDNANLVEVVDPGGSPYPAPATTPSS